LEITPGLAWFHGHFPGNPILPGVVQLHWAVLISQSIFGFSVDPVEIKQLKFKSVVTPGGVLELTLTRRDENIVEFGYSSLDLQHSQGRLIFDEAASC
jgi:3-hydroxymyristoyl/3-hydroxydecanoyl-(acyl carrier protein) dehydratase